MHPEKKTIHVLRVYMLSVVLFITLFPFHLSMPDKFDVFLMGPTPDILKNIVLFMPLGFLWQMRSPSVKWFYRLKPVLLSILLSSAIEAVQLFEATRYTTGSDFLANVIGGWLGSEVFILVRNRAVSQNNSVDLLELPLIHIVYLLIPFIWTQIPLMASRREHIFILIMSLSIGVFVVVNIFTHRREMLPAFKRRHLLVFILLWIFICTFPSLKTHYLKIGFLTFWGLAYSFFATLKSSSYKEKRFEQQALKYIIPWFLIMLMIMQIWPGNIPEGSWMSNTLQVEFNIELSRQRDYYLLIEICSAFVILGYILSEFQGRSQLSTLKQNLRVILFVLVFESLILIIKNFTHAQPVNLIYIAISLIFACLGILLYRTQLEFIQIVRFRGTN